MSTTDWLRGQVARLEREIQSASVFDNDRPASIEQIRALRGKIVIHRYLLQQLLRRVPILDAEDYETQEFFVSKRA